MLEETYKPKSPGCSLGGLGFPGGSDGQESACNAGELGQEDPLEKEMATPSSILSWKILWPEEPAGLQSMGLQESDTTLTKKHNKFLHRFYGFFLVDPSCLV